MATRFYLPNAGSPSVSPAFDASWEQTGQAERRKLFYKPNNTETTTLTDKTVTVPVTTSQQILNRQYISDPILGAQSISGSISAVIRCTESATTANAFLQIVARVVSRDGTSVTGTLFSGATDVEMPTTTATRINNGNPISTVSANDGDRIVIEIGIDAQAPSAGTTATQRFGNNAATDFALTSALTTDLNPWIELSTTLTMSFSGYKLTNRGIRPYPFSPGLAR